MDVYKTPGSKLIDENNRPYRPVKGVLVGLGYTILLTTIVGMIWLFAFGAISGFDLASPNLESEMAGSTLYMISDTIVSAIVLFFGGRAVGKRTPGKEFRFGVILAIITAIIYLLLMVATESLETFPLIYILITFVITAIAIPYGARSTAKT